MNSEANVVATTSPKAPRTPLEHIQAQSNSLFSKCLIAFHSFAGLGELAENMRILSLNAELAAGRAGEHGNAVRALTQYTRELVNRLYSIEKNMQSLKTSSYNHSANSLKTLLQLRMLDRAHRLIKIGGGEHAGTASQRSIEARKDTMTNLLGNVRGMTEGVSGLSSKAEDVNEVMSQAGSIATNIAIEASTAGAHEEEFEQVAFTMREYVHQLREMIDLAGGSIRDAGSIGESLEKRAKSKMD